MTDEERNLRELVALCQKGCDTSIKWANKSKKWRRRFVLLNAGLWLFFLLFDLYLRRYFSCVLDVVMGTIIIWFVHSRWDKNIKEAREWKRIFADDKRKANKMLQDYLDYKERGFE